MDAMNTMNAIEARKQLVHWVPAFRGPPNGQNTPSDWKRCLRVVGVACQSEPYCSYPSTIGRLAAAHAQGYNKVVVSTKILQKS
jgi:hypothetical protein